MLGFLCFCAWLVWRAGRIGKVRIFAWMAGGWVNGRAAGRIWEGHMNGTDFNAFFFFKKTKTGLVD